MNYPEYRAKVRAEFDEKILWMLPENMVLTRSSIEAFLDTCLDNLLVEVEGWIPGEENGSDPDTVPPNELNWNNGFAYGVNETRYKLLQALARFKGENCDCPITKGLKWHTTECVFGPKT